MTSPHAVSPALVEIRPEVAIFSAFSRLNYKPWYALAEFVDNALQSYLSWVASGDPVAQTVRPLKVQITISNTSIEISDNAAGISWRDFPRAFMPASPPPDQSGLSEYGLGMKAAACWFAKRWTVCTSAIGEGVERTITFDVPLITSNKIERLPISEAPADSAAHCTVVKLFDLNTRPKGRTIEKIKRHLASIYRVFLREGTVEISVNEGEVTFEPHELLVAPWYLSPEQPSRLWRKEFALQLDEDHRVWGWAGLLKRASVTNAGLSIFRRMRLIEGSYGEAYRPELLFRKSNTFTYQRLVGELFVEGFVTSHTKDGIQWSDWEDDVLAWLKNELDREPLPILKQAEGHRATPPRSAHALDRVASETGTLLTQRVSPLIDDQLGAAADSAELPTSLELGNVLEQRRVSFRLQHAGEEWQVEIDLIADPDVEPWLALAGASQPGERDLKISLNLSHPFMLRFATPSGAEIRPMVRLAVGFAVAEATARAIGVDRAGTIRRNLNQLLREALAAPVADLEEQEDLENGDA